MFTISRQVVALILIMAISFSVHGQEITIEGFVTDAKTDEPLAYATIGILGTMIGTATNSEGRFLLSIPRDLKDSVFYCSYMGYKSFEKKVSDVGPNPRIVLDLDTFTLDEVEIRPWQPWDYVWNAMQKIKANYPQEPYMTNGYYSEYMSENDVFLKFTEGVIETYNPAYGDTVKSQSRVLQARRRDDLGTLQFMRDKLEKKYAKEKRKAQKKGKEWEQGESIDEEILSASFGGPEEMLSADPLRDTASFLDIHKRKKYRYTIAGYSRYFGEQVIIIGFETRGKYEHQRQEGNIYISLESDAIMAIEFESEIVIPAAVRPLIFVFGFGITNPQLSGMVHYRPVQGRWYLNDIAIEGGTRLTKKKMFKKNDRSTFYVEMALINQNFEFEHVYKIPEEEQIDRDKTLEDQVESDPQFWDSYKVARPTRLNQ